MESSLQYHRFLSDDYLKLFFDQTAPAGQEGGAPKPSGGSRIAAALGRHVRKENVPTYASQSGLLEKYFDTRSRHGFTADEAKDAIQWFLHHPFDSESVILFLHRQGYSPEPYMVQSAVKDVVPRVHLHDDGSFTLPRNQPLCVPQVLYILQQCRVACSVVIQENYFVFKPQGKVRLIFILYKFKNFILWKEQGKEQGREREQGCFSFSTCC